jgi:quercetin dioxygenase-like cupin family protein
MQPAAVTANRTTWRVGQRVSRQNSDELGTVTEIDGKIKVQVGQRADELLPTRAAGQRAARNS